MTALHAYLFLLLGAMLRLTPDVFPEWFPLQAFIGTSTSELWIRFMGWVNGAIGAGYITSQQVLPAFARMLTWRPAPLPATVYHPGLKLAENEETQTRVAA